MNPSLASHRYVGRAVLITGGASGLGEATAYRLAAEGASVAVLDRDEPNGRRVVQALQQSGAQAWYFSVDVTDAQSVEHAVGAAFRAAGRLDLAVNGAGIVGARAKVPDYPLEQWDRVLAVNVTGVFHCLRAQLPLLAAQGGGAIVNIASIFGTIAAPDISAYITSKHAVVGLTRAAALEWGPRQVRVNAVAPSYIRTPMTEQQVPEKAWNELAARHAFGRCGTPDDVAATIAFLGSDDARFLTGTLHQVDGGLTIS